MYNLNVMSLQLNSTEDREKIESDETLTDFEQNAENERNKLAARVQHLSIQLEEMNAVPSSTTQHYRIASDADEDQDAQWRDSEAPDNAYQS